MSGIILQKFFNKCVTVRVVYVPFCKVRCNRFENYTYYNKLQF